MVEAIALGGSTPVGAADGDSDLDFCVYAGEAPSLAVRTAVAGAFGRLARIGCTFWEPGDEWPATTDRPAVDLIYRAPTWLEAELQRTLVRHEATVGCSTCLWHNVRTSTLLFDRRGWYARLQRFAAQSYSEALRQAVVAKNHPLLRETAFSYLRQIETAVRRQDLVSVQHRGAALLASYFDLLFAANWLPHPGEKRLVEHASLLCAHTPVAFEQHVADVIRAAGMVPPDARVAEAVRTLIDGLDDLLATLGLIDRRASLPVRMSA
jgi:hypothetical protein